MILFMQLIENFIDFLNVKLLEQQVDNLDMLTSKAKLKALSSFKFSQTLQQLESYLDLVR